MKKFNFGFIVLLLICGCQREENTADDYVLIEFASKLEEDYEKIHPAPKSDRFTSEKSP